MRSRPILFHSVSVLLYHYIRYQYVFSVLHPYFKLEYIKIAWGGSEDQAEELARGNRGAKNWHEEAVKVIEAAVS
jgi:hypothetical protein